MRWFKHITTARNDEVMAELLEEFGSAGYGVWWIIMEMIAANMDKSDRCQARYSLRKWAQSCAVSAVKFKKILKFLKDRQMVEIGEEGKFLTIRYANLLKYRDEFTRKRARKSGPDPESIRTRSGTEAEPEPQPEAEKENPPPRHAAAVPCPHREIIKLYHATLPMLRKVKVWNDTRRRLLRSRWQEDEKQRSLTWWQEFFKQVKESEFLLGVKSGFQADLEWLIRPENFAKVLEGKYHDQEKRAAPYRFRLRDGQQAALERYRRRLRKNGGKFSLRDLAPRELRPLILAHREVCAKYERDQSEKEQEIKKQFDPAVLSMIGEVYTNMKAHGFLPYQLSRAGTKEERHEMQHVRH